MRLHRMRLRNFGGVLDKTIDFGPNVTVVAGPNEVGKSSFQAALHLLFLYPDNSNATPVRSFIPTDQDNTGPEVELEAEAEPYRFVYRERWRYKPKTELVIRAPQPANFTGRDAHDRAKLILDEAADFALFEALQLVQGDPLAQADLDESFSLSRALDGAAGGTDPGAEHDSLYEAVVQAYERYWTPRTGKESGELVAARELAGATEAAWQALEGQLADLDAYVQAVASGERRLERQEKVILGRRKHLAEQQDQADAIARLERQISELAAAEAKASLVLTQASNARHERMKALESEDAAREQIRQIEEQLAPAQGRSATLREAAERTKHAYEQSRTAYERAVQARKTAEAVVDYLKAKSAYASLKNRIGLIDGLRSKHARLEAEIERIRVDDMSLKALQEAHNALQVAAGKLEAQAPNIVLEARQAIALTTKGAEQQTLPAGQLLELPVIEPLTLEVPEVLSLRIDPGSTLAERQAERDGAADSLAILCDRLGVKDLSEAQEKHRHRGELLQAMRAAEAELGILLDGKQPENLMAAQARHGATLKEMEPMNLPAPETLEEAESVLRDAREKAQAQESSRDECDDEFRRAERAANDAARGLQALNTRLALARDVLAKAEKLLSNARAQASDESLTADLNKAAAAHEQAKAALEDGQSQLAARSPEAARIGLRSAEDAFERAKDERDQLRDELNRARGQLASLRDQGLQEKRDEAKAEYEQAHREFTSVARRANAARRLHRTLVAHREAARRRYLAPFQEHVERLVRLVQAPDLRLTFHDDLSVQARTVGDTTVPFASLSGGAKEQIGLACRLAAAMLVADGGGVPVLLDDTLGYSDPDRLPKLGAMIDYASRSVQIVIFTCQPERFADVGAAQTVHLET